MKDYKAHDNCIYMFRIMSALNRLAKYEGESLVIDEWLNLRGKYGVRITEHPDFEGLKEDWPKLYKDLKFIEDRFYDGNYPELIKYSYTL